MSSEMKKTLAFVAVAVLLTGAAFVRVPDRTGSSETFRDQGQPFFPDFKDPNACTDLEVVDFDDSTANAKQFRVKFENGKWVIPSHHNYPADAKDRLAKTAGGVTELTKDTVRSDRVEDHEALGVIDPLDLKAPLKGRGKRVTLRDKSEKVLADFIIGNEVKDRPGMRYVRVPNSKRTYGVGIKAEPSTRFADWIETNLLKLDTSHIRSVKFDNHKVLPEEQRIIPGDVLRIERKDSSAPWALDGGVPAGKELNSEKVSAMTNALADLKIVGVRTKPEALSRDLKLAKSNDVKPTTQEELRSLVARGFYPTRDGLYSNQGDVIVSTDEGAVYTLRYGEVVFGSGESVEAGTKDEGKDKGKGTPKKAGETTENRFLMVTVAFDPKLLPEPEKPKVPLVIPDDPFQKAPDDPKRVAEEKAFKEKADREKAERDKVIAEAEKKVKALADRFAPWYYVTPGDSFHTIELDRAALVKDKSADNKPETPPIGGLPPGLPAGFPHP
jgi:hypothetical protein